MLNRLFFTTLSFCFLISTNAIAQSIDNSNSKIEILGSVINDQTGEGVSYALIQISQTTRGTVANHKGEFTLWANVEDTISLVTVSSLGYQAKEVVLSGKRMKISLSPTLQYLKQVEVKAQRTSPKEILMQLVEGYQQQLQGKQYQLEAYYYSAWVNEQIMDTAINEAVYTLLYDYYGEREFPKGAVLQKRRVNDKASLIPWPQHAYVSSDFRPNIGLLNRSVLKTTIVDSINAVGNEASIFYHIENPGRSIGWSSIDTYRGILVYDEEAMRLISHRKLMTFDDSGKRSGFLQASYFVNYEMLEGLNLGTYSQLAYTAIHKTGKVSGVDITRINTIKFSDFDFPEEPIFKIKEAPYNPSFWENYNRIK